MLHSQEKGEDDFEAKLGIMYSGKELESKKAKHRHYPTEGEGNLRRNRRG